METLSSTSGFGTEPNLTGNAPHTPPYTPYRTKRPTDLNDSPASARSIQPIETESPAKPSREQVENEVVVEELVEGDAGYMTDVEVVYPHELEEAESASEDDSGSDEDSESGDGISSRLSRLGCDDSPEAEFEKKRRAEHLRKRRDSRIFKRSHSQSVKSDDTDVTDPDAMADHDVHASARRLRRRVRGPNEVNAGMDEVVRSSSQLFGLASSPEFLERQDITGYYESSEREPDTSGDDAMDIDDLERQANDRSHVR